MRSYGKIETGFWQNPKVKGLSERGRTLLTYLLSCPHGNSVGCFVLPDGYISADLGYSSEVVSEHVRELVSKGFIERDEMTFLTRIRGWWGHNTIENANVAKAALKAMRQLPRNSVFTKSVQSIVTINNKFINALRNEFGDVFATPEPNLTEPNRSGTEPEPKPEPSRPVRIVEKKLEDAPERASRASRMQPVNTSDPKNRKVVWEQKVTEYINLHWPFERAQQAITEYLLESDHGKKEFEIADQEMRAVRTDGSIKPETRMDRDNVLQDTLDGMARLKAAI